MHEAYKLIFVNICLSILLGIGLLIYTLVFPKKQINFFAVLLLISILPIVSIFRPGTYEAGDLTLHSVFLQSFYDNLRDGTLVPRWAGGLCGGYGCPVFLFEYTMPFYIGSLFHTVGFSYLNSMKLFLATAFILSGLTMYLFINDELGRIPAFVASLLYLFAPIHLMEMHFRVSVGTVAAFIFIPLTFLFAKKSLRASPLFIVLGAVNFLCFVLSHSSVTFIVVPASLIYAWIKKESLREMLYPLFSFLLGGGISAYYVLPALAEIKYTWTSMGLNTVTGFKPFLEYIYSPARFGLLFQGNNGELRLIVGYAQLFIVCLALYGIFRRKYKRSEVALVIFLLLFFFICFVLMLSFTKPVWESIFFLRTFFLPWRMLVPIAFATAFLGALVVRNWHKLPLIIFCLFIILSTILNWGNRKMVPPDPDAYAKHWSLYSEYYEPNNPLYVARYNARVAYIPELVLHRPVAHLEILSGKGEVQETKRTQIDHEYLVHADSKMLLSENTYYFPGWNVYVNRTVVPVDITNAKRFGTLTFSLPKGLYLVNARFEDTPVRKLGACLSLTAMTTSLLFVALKTTFRRNS